MATHNLFKGIKRVLATNTAYTATTNNDYLYFVRESGATEGDIWFQGIHYGHFGEHDLDAINTALAGFIGTGATTNKDVKTYIDDEIAKLSSGMTTSVEVAQGSFSGLTITDDSSTANVKDYKVSLTNVAPADELAAEIAARKAVDGQNGQTYVADANAEYIDNATSLSDADSKLDAAIKALADKTITENGSVENYVSISVTTSSTGTQIAIDDTALANKIAGMDLSEVHEAGKAIVSVSEADGVVSASTGTINAQYVDIADAGSLIQATDVEGALQELAGKINANEITNADGSINVTAGQNSTDVNVNIKSGEKVLAKDGAAGLYTDIKLSGITPSSTTIKEEYALIGTDGSQLGETVKIYKDSSLVSMQLVEETVSGETKQLLRYTYIDNSGNTQTTDVDVSLLLAESEFKDGLQVNGAGEVSVKKDSTSEDFLSVSSNGVKVSGIQDEIDAAKTAATAYTNTQIEALDYTDTAVAGQYVSEVDEADGVISVQRANVSEATLNNYSKGSDATAVAATDTVNQAISKLENQIEKAQDAATTKVEKDANASHLTVTSTTASDGSVTYTIGEDDIASASDLTAETAARKAVDGQNGDTYAANTGANYISGATNLNDADVKLDTALKGVDDRLDTVEDNYATAVTVNGVSAATQNNAIALQVDADHIELGTALSGTSVTAAADDKVDEVLQSIIDALDAVGSGAYTGLSTTDNAIDLSGVADNGQTIALKRETATVDTAKGGHIEIKESEVEGHEGELYGVMYWIDEETA